MLGRNVNLLVDSSFPVSVSIEEEKPSLKLSDFNLPDFKSIKEVFECGVAMLDCFAYTKNHIATFVKAATRFGFSKKESKNHDKDKFNPAMFLTYANYFYYSNQLKKHTDSGNEAKISYLKKQQQKWQAAYDQAHDWHIKHNPHHAEYWLARGFNSIPEENLKEMMPDWESAQLTINKDNPDYNLAQGMHDFFNKKFVGLAKDDQGRSIVENGALKFNAGEYLSEKTKQQIQELLDTYYPLNEQPAPVKVNEDYNFVFKKIPQLLAASLVAEK